MPQPHEIKIETALSGTLTHTVKVPDAVVLQLLGAPPHAEVLWYENDGLTVTWSRHVTTAADLDAPALVLTPPSAADPDEARFAGRPIRPDEARFAGRPIRPGFVLIEQDAAGPGRGDGCTPLYDVWGPSRGVCNEIDPGRALAVAALALAPADAPGGLRNWAVATLEAALRDLRAGRVL